MPKNQKKEDAKRVYAEISYVDNENNLIRKEKVTTDPKKTKHSDEFVSREELYEKAKEVAFRHDEAFIEWFNLKNNLVNTERLWVNKGNDIEVYNLHEEGSFPESLFKWGVPDGELNYQVEKYDSLKFSETTRFNAVGLLIFSAILTTIAILAGWIPSLNLIFVFTTLVLAFFIYKGSKAAIIATLIYWTAGRLFPVFLMFLDVQAGTTVDTTRVAGILIWWAIVAKALWQSYQVEKEREKRHAQKDSKSKEQENKEERSQKGKNLDKPRYCNKCGEELDKDSNYCASCGNKINN